MSKDDNNHSPILVVASGGTILKQQEGAQMEWSVRPEDLMEKAAPGLNYSLLTAYQGLAADLQMSDIVAIARLIAEHASDKVLVTVGTDVLEELAFALDYLLGTSKKVTLTGSMRPYGRPGYEGIVNLQSSIATLQDENVPNGVYVVFNEQIFLGNTIYKHHSARIDAFSAVPGPIGSVISGMPYLSALPKPRPSRDLSALNADQIDQINVPIVWTHTSSHIETLAPEHYDGIVVGAMGAGSMPTRLKLHLEQRFTKTIPVVVSTRCAEGPNHVGQMYTGAVEKYEDNNFIVRAFETLNALQSRIKLHLDIAFETTGEYYSKRD